jgi:hypothetical protein
MKKYSLLVLGFCVISLFMGMPLSADADVIYNNFGEQDAFGVASGLAIQAPMAWGNAFRVGDSNYLLSSIELAAGYISGDSNVLNVELRNDEQGRPGSTVLESYEFNNLPSYYTNSNVLLSASSVAHPLLTADAIYWVVASVPDGTFSGWNFNTTGDVGLAGWSTDNWQTYEMSSYYQKGAFRIQGDLAPVPEPCSMLLLGSGLAGLFGLRRKLAA